MGGRLLLSVYSSSHASRIRRLSANLPISATGRSYSEESGSGHGVGERAPSTAEEFKRVAEEKARQGITSQTAEKAQDAAGEAATGEDSTSESVKEAHKEPRGGGGDFHKTGTSDGQEVTGG